MTDYDSDRLSDDSGSIKVGSLPPEITLAILQLCKAMDAAAIYGLNHPLFTDAVKTAHNAMTNALEKTPRLVITLPAAELRFNGVALATRSNLTRHLYKAMKAKELTSFTISKGMQLAEFTKLIDVLIRRDADFHEAVKSGEVGHVSRQNVVFREIHEGERVVREDQDAAKRGASEVERMRAEAEAWLARGDQSGKEVGDGGDDKGGHPSGTGLQQIVAFLKGDVNAVGVEGDAAMKDLASDPEKLAALIMEAAVLRQRSPDLSAGASLSDLVIGCLRRSYEGLKTSPVMRKPQIRQDLKRTLMLLEKKVTDRMAEITGGGDPAADQRIAKEIAAMQKDLKGGGALREMSGATVQGKDGRAGSLSVMGDENWRKITVQSGQGSGGEGPGGAASDMAALSMVLTRIDEMMRSPSPDRNYIGRLVKEAGQRAVAITNRTVERIDRFARDIAHPARDQSVEKARKRERWLLAEIVQELLQPLTVMNCTLQMISLGLSGKMDDGVRDAITMAGEAGARIEKLTKRLLEITGVPEQLTVDRDRIDRDIYR